MQGNPITETWEGIKKQQDAIPLPGADNGCEMLRQLWSIAVRDFDISHPGLTGTASRWTSFIELSHVPTFASLATTTKA